VRSERRRGGAYEVVADYTHRDRRAHRDVRRAFWTVVGVSLGFTGLALLVPLPFFGLGAVVALGVLGAGCVAWSERMLGSYTNDLRRAREGEDVDGFLRVETRSMVGLDRTVGGPTTASPHSRRRPRGTADHEQEPPARAGSDRDQV